MRTLALAALWIATIPAADAATIAAHRVIYDLKLARTSDGASLSSAEGRLAFEVQGSACAGWTVNFRMVNRFAPSEGDSRTVDTQSTAFESGDALELQYSQREFLNNKPQGETRISVERKATDAETAGTLQSGDGKPFTVPAGALFPMQHQLHLMDLAASGGDRDTSVVYDGSDGANSYRAITFIGKKKEAGANARDTGNGQARLLKDLPSWPMSISYYSLAGNSDTPSYQVTFDLYQNGVATGLVLDYGNFVLNGELRQLELLTSDPCP
ncbi:MAG: DUF1849 family protein [Rhizobiales bacterium]|nr:DUF1849 family protein [Hyphomicrobiales bacterium]MBI3672845.1 DUF1849 family protein [Hyphomicrobiales bacterium]